MALRAQRLEHEVAGRIEAGPVDAAFREAVRTFLDDALTEDLREAARQTTGLKSAREACHEWQRRLHARGWAAPGWPVEYGGAGWSMEQQLHFEAACAENDAPLVHSSGIRTIGPLIMAEGTVEQKHRYLPAILRGEHEWCQGYSEPQAGSDLTALSLRAEVQGNEIVLNGSKLWTSFAQYATHMFLLARCEPGSSGKDGLVFLLVEMDLPGVEVRPIRFIDGECETNEVFFNNVRTPARDRIGEIGDGWHAARRLMTIARSNNTPAGLLRRALRAARRGMTAAGDVLPEDAARMAALEMRIEGLDALVARKAASASGVEEPATASMLKLIATELHQAITHAGLSAAPHAAFAQAKYFATRAATIYSGTSEIHRNTLGRTALG